MISQTLTRLTAHRYSKVLKKFYSKIFGKFPGKNYLTYLQHIQLVFTCSKLAIETPELVVRYVQS